MSNEIETRYLLVTLRPCTGEEADQIIDTLEMSVTPAHGQTTTFANRGDGAGGIINHAPELWVLVLDGPEFDRVWVMATADAALDQIIDYMNDENVYYEGVLSRENVIEKISEAGYVISLDRHNYPVHPHADPNPGVDFTEGATA